MAASQASVVIAGAGPTGLTAALLLARAGVAPLLLERRATTAIHPRARGLNLRTMEIYRTLGLESAVLRAGAPLAASRYMLFVESLAGQEIRRVLDDDLVATPEDIAAVSPTKFAQCAQDHLEPLLLDAARRAGATVRFGTEVTSCAQDAAAVTVEVVERASGTRATLRADYLIAADGATSGVRQALGIAMTGASASEHFVNIYFRANLGSLVQGREFGICFVEQSGSPGIFLAVNNTDLWLFNVAYDPATGATPADFTPSRCIELVRGAVGLADLAVEVLSILPWHTSAQVAQRLQLGRIFLAGDAAHVMPPAGGFGLNTGVQDAHNLAWKLALVLDGAASPALLQTYDVERRPVAHLVVDQSLRDFEAPTPDSHGAAGHPTGADDVPPDGPPEWSADGPPDGRGAPRDALNVVLGYAYASRAIVAAASAPVADPPETVPALAPTLELDGRPGTRAPHSWLERVGERLSTLDLFDQHFVLLVGADGAAWRDGAQEAASALGVPLDVYRIVPTATDATDLLDATDAWPAAYGVTSAGAVLVRPDGFVAWHAVDHAENPAAAVAAALRALLCRD